MRKQRKKHKRWLSSFGEKVLCPTSSMIAVATPEAQLVIVTVKVNEAERSRVAQCFRSRIGARAP